MGRRSCPEAVVEASRVGGNAGGRVGWREIDHTAAQLLALVEVDGSAGIVRIFTETNKPFV